MLQVELQRAEGLYDRKVLHRRFRNLSKLTHSNGQGARQLMQFKKPKPPAGKRKSYIQKASKSVTKDSKRKVDARKWEDLQYFMLNYDVL